MALPNDPTFIGQLVLGLAALGVTGGLVVSAAMFIRGIQARADAADARALDAQTRAASAVASALLAEQHLNEFKIDVARNYATQEQLRLLTDRMDSSFTAMRRELKEEYQALRDLILQFLKES